MYWIELVKELVLWKNFSNIAKQNRELLQEHKMRVDWLGRIYTVINMSEEVVGSHQKVQEGWVLQQLNSYNEILLNIGLSDHAYPEIRKIPDSYAYLVIMYPELYSVSFLELIKHIVIYGVGFFTSLITYNFLSKFIDPVAVFEFLGDLI